MDSELKNDSIIFYLFNNDNSCELKTLLNKPLVFEKPMEAALSEIIIPNQLSRKKIDGLKIDFNSILYEKMPTLLGGGRYLCNENDKFDLTKRAIYEAVDINIDLSEISNLPTILSKYVDSANVWIKSHILKRYPDVFNLKYIDTVDNSEYTTTEEKIFTKLKIEYDQVTEKYKLIMARFNLPYSYEKDQKKKSIL